MKIWEENVRKVVPYTPGEQPKTDGVIKLNTNENPYPPAPGVAKALREFDVDGLRLYPDPTVGSLVEAIADNYGLDKSRVFVGVGSDDVLAMIFMTFFNSKKPILFPDRLMQEGGQRELTRNIVWRRLHPCIFHFYADCRRHSGQVQYFSPFPRKAMEARVLHPPVPLFCNIS